MTRDVLFKYGRVGKKCGFVEMEKWRSIDVDTLEDLEIAQALIKKNNTMQEKLVFVVNKASFFIT